MNDLKIRDLLSVDPFEDAFRNFVRPWASRGIRLTPDIKVDLLEGNTDYTLRADVPGVNKEDIKVDIDDNKLTISVEVPPQQAQQTEQGGKANGRMIRNERHSGYASRSVWLDCPVDQTATKAGYQNGVLELVLPKLPEQPSKRIPIA